MRKPTEILFVCALFLAIHVHFIFIVSDNPQLSPPPPPTTKNEADFDGPMVHISESMVRFLVLKRMKSLASSASSLRYISVENCTKSSLILVNPLALSRCRRRSTLRVANTIYAEWLSRGKWRFPTTCAWRHLWFHFPECSFGLKAWSLSCVCVTLMCAFEILR